jgi:menaquinone-dependent protoporphyrinogen oxidase
MTVLVTAAGKHGATVEIAERVAEVLADRGLEVDLREPREVESVTGYDAVVLGSAVYVGRWVEDARAFVSRHGGELAARPTWLFSSGPIGDPPKPAGEKAVDVREVVEAVRPREHKVLAGRIDRGALSLAERVVVKAVGAAPGDYRDWAEIDAWAGTIAAEVAAAQPV